MPQEAIATPPPSDSRPTPDIGQLFSQPGEVKLSDVYQALSANDNGKNFINQFKQAHPDASSPLQVTAGWLKVNKDKIQPGFSFLNDLQQAACATNPASTPPSPASESTSTPPRSVSPVVQKAFDIGAKINPILKSEIGKEWEYSKKPLSSLSAVPVVGPFIQKYGVAEYANAKVQSGLDWLDSAAKRLNTNTGSKILDSSAKMDQMLEGFATGLARKGLDLSSLQNAVLAATLHKPAAGLATEGVGLKAIGFIKNLVGKGAGLTFGYQAMRDAYDTIPKFRSAIQNGDMQAAGTAIADFGSDVAIALGVAKEFKQKEHFDPATEAHKRELKDILDRTKSAEKIAQVREKQEGAEKTRQKEKEEALRKLQETNFRAGLGPPPLPKSSPDPEVKEPSLAEKAGAPPAAATAPKKGKKKTEEAAPKPEAVAAPAPQAEAQPTEPEALIEETPPPLPEAKRPKLLSKDIRGNSVTYDMPDEAHKQLLQFANAYRDASVKPGNKIEKMKEVLATHEDSIRKMFGWNVRENVVAKAQDYASAVKKLKAGQPAPKMFEAKEQPDVAFNKRGKAEAADSPLPLETKQPEKVPVQAGPAPPPKAKAEKKTPVSSPTPEAQAKDLPAAEKKLNTAIAKDAGVEPPKTEKLTEANKEQMKMLKKLFDSGKTSGMGEGFDPFLKMAAEARRSGKLKTDQDFQSMYKQYHTLSGFRNEAGIGQYEDQFRTLWGLKGQGSIFDASKPKTLAGQLEGVKVGQEPTEHPRDILPKGSEFTIGKEDLKGLSRTNAQGVILPMEEGSYKVNGHSDDGKTLYVSKFNDSTQRFDNVYGGIKIANRADLKKITAKPSAEPIDTSTKVGLVANDLQRLSPSEFPVEITIANKSRVGLAKVILDSPEEAVKLEDRQDFKEAIGREGAGLIRVKGAGRYSREVPITGNLGVVKEAAATPEPPPLPEAASPKSDTTDIEARIKGSKLMSVEGQDLVVKNEDGTELTRVPVTDKKATSKTIDAILALEKSRAKPEAKAAPKKTPAATPKDPEPERTKGPDLDPDTVYTDPQDNGDGTTLEFRRKNTEGDYVFKVIDPQGDAAGWRTVDAEDVRSLKKGDGNPIQAAKAEGGRVKLGADVKSLGEVLGASLYTGGAAKIIPKELAQNAFDAIRGIPEGKVVARLNNTNRSIEVSDNGKGMTREDLETVFTDLGASGKRGDASASGGFGIAKAAPLLRGESLSIETIADAIDGKRYKSSFTSTPEQLMGEGVKVDTVEVPKSTPTGTKIVSVLPKDEYLGDVRRYMEQLSKSSKIPGRFDFYTDYGEHQSTIPSLSSSATEFKKIADTSIPGVADIELGAAKEQDNDIGQLFGSISVRIHNNGLYQFEKTFYAPGDSKLSGIPNTLDVDIKPTAKEGSPDYPFTANRESMRDVVHAKLDQLIKKYIIDPGVEKSSNIIAKAFRDMPLVAGFHLMDAGGRLEPVERDVLSRNEAYRKIASVIDKTSRNAMAKLFTKSGTIQRAEAVSSVNIDTGIVLSGKVHGVNIKDPDGESHRILVNPFTLEEGETPEDVASLVWHTIKHELLHNSIQGHYEAFTSGEVEMSRALGMYHEISAMEEIRNAFEDPQRPGRFSAEFKQALEIYRRSRARPERTKDILGGEESRTGGLEYGPRGQGQAGSPVRPSSQATRTASTPE